MASANRYLYADIIFISYKLVQNGLSYGIEREILVDEIEAILKERNLDTLEDELGEGSLTFKDKASALVRKLVDYGWFYRETTTNYKEIINFNDYAVTIERSALYKSASSSSRKISLVITPKSFKDYFDETNYIKKEEIDQAAKELKRLDLVSIDYGRGYESHLIKKINLNLDFLNKAYEFVKRSPKSNKELQCLSLLKVYEDEENLLGVFANEMIKKLEEKTSIKKYLDIENLKECIHILLAIKNLLSQEEEVFKRNFSIKLFGDSKRFEAIEGKVLKILKDFSNDATLTLEEFNVVSNPSYVYFKGNAVIKLKSAALDISELKYGVGINSKELSDIESIYINAAKIITIENLTTFNTFNEPDFLSIYLGGFHNSARRELLQKLKKSNNSKEFYHFGDIDCGGLKILRNLIEKTGIDFIVYNMNLETIKQGRNYCKALTLNDRKTLEEMLTDNFYIEFYDLFRYMLDEDVKLEQEWFS